MLGEIGGLGLAFNTQTLLSIAAGMCADSTGAVTIALGAFTKSIAGAWAAGSGSNGMGVGLTAMLNTWYHVFAVIVASVGDAYFDTSVTAANKPPATTAFRRIGSFKLDAAVHILAFDQYGDRFDWRTPVPEATGVVGATTGTAITLAGAPLGIVAAALLTGYMNDATSANTLLYLSSLAQVDMTPGSGTAMTGYTGSTATVSPYAATIMTNAAGQIRRRVSTTTAAMSLLTNGWIDTRGRG